VDPHLYKTTAGDNARLAGADIVFYNGLLLEGKMIEVLEALAGRKPVVAVAGKIDKKLLLELPQFKGHHDPHVWFDVSLWMEAVKAVRDGLCQEDPAHADDYQRSAADYLAELQELHQWCKSRADELPAEKRVLITSHDAYNYFGRAYGFEVIGVQGISTEEQATTKAIVDLSDLIKRRKVKALFTESSVSPKAIQAIIENCRSAGWEVEEGGSIFSDAMDEPGEPAGNYIGMVRHNVNTIVDALK
jgi:manganese/zinc/iron transport system substrate-binding protein